MIVHHSLLSEDALMGLIEAFVNREGTDYGLKDISFDEKVYQVKQQILDNGIVVAFDPETESANLLLMEEAKQLEPDWESLPLFHEKNNAQSDFE